MPSIILSSLLCFHSQGLILPSQENYRTFLLKIECLSIRFECLALDKGAFCHTVWELIVLHWLCDTQLAKEMTCPKISLPLIKATATGYPSSGLFSETQVLNLMSDIVAQRRWKESEEGLTFSTSRGHTSASATSVPPTAQIWGLSTGVSPRARIFGSWSRTLFRITHPHRS